jgi:hypothetical protein
MKTTKIEKIKTTHYKGDVYNLELKSNTKIRKHDDLYWVDGNTGLITHNCFPKDVTALYKITDHELLKFMCEYNEKLRNE